MVEFFGERNPKQKALSLAEDFPGLIAGYGLPKLFISIRILRVLRFKPEDVDAKICLSVLSKNIADLALALPYAVRRDLHGKDGLYELLRVVRENKKKRLSKDAKFARIHEELQKLVPEDEEAQVPSETGELVKIMTRALALETSRR